MSSDFYHTINYSTLKVLRFGNFRIFTVLHWRCRFTGRESRQKVVFAQILLKLHPSVKMNLCLILQCAIFFIFQGFFCDAGKCNRVTEVSCANGKSCIHKSWECDGEEDCSDGSDELNCEFEKCTSAEFKCKNKKCIPISQRCDQLDQCGDFSDEIGCRTLPSLDCKSETAFHCSDSKLCIDKIKVCDGRKHCPKGDDEPTECGVNECLKNNTGCSQICKDLKIGFECSCKEGFELNADEKTCNDVDECGIFGTCSQICKNILGSYKCQCQKGYSLQRDRRSCKVKGPRPSLIVANRVNVIQVDTSGKEIKCLIPSKKIGGVLAIDINPNDGYIYWADYVKGMISRAKVDGTSNRTERIANGKLTKAEGIAVDWIGNKIYWTNTGKKSIEVADLDGSYRKELITSDVEKPRGIAVLPSKRLMFWTDWGTNPKIEKASMDGTDRKTIIFSEDLQWPNAVTVDQVSERLYWVDRRKGYLGSSTLEGTDIRKIVTSNVQSSFGLAVFEDNVFWSQATGKVFKADKINGENIEDIKGAFFSPYMVQVYHPAAKPKGSNPCGSNNGGCMHLCLLSTSQKGFSCACADDYDLAEDGETCE